MGNDNPPSGSPPDSGSSPDTSSGSGTGSGDDATASGAASPSTGPAGATGSEGGGAPSSGGNDLPGVTPTDSSGTPQGTPEASADSTEEPAPPAPTTGPAAPTTTPKPTEAPAAPMEDVTAAPTTAPNAIPVVTVELELAGPKEMQTAVLQAIKNELFRLTQFNGTIITLTDTRRALSAARMLQAAAAPGALCANGAETSSATIKLSGFANEVSIGSGVRAPLSE